MQNAVDAGMVTKTFPSSRIHSCGVDGGGGGGPRSGGGEGGGGEGGGEGGGDGTSDGTSDVSGAGCSSDSSLTTFSKKKDGLVPLSGPSK